MIRPYTSRDIAIALGISLDTFYRTRHGREAAGMPRPISERPLKWERTGFDAWLTRFHPLRPPAPANDQAAPLAPQTDEECRARLAAAYGPA